VTRQAVSTDKSMIIARIGTSSRILLPATSMSGTYDTWQLHIRLTRTVMLSRTLCSRTRPWTRT